MNGPKIPQRAIRLYSTVPIINEELETGFLFLWVKVRCIS